MLTNVENVIQVEGIVQIDNRFFVNCRFERCQVVYTGGDVGWAGTTFTDCHIVLQGDADRTVRLLGLFGFGLGKSTTTEPPKDKIGFSL